jgi:hypothetical protein
MGQYTTSIPEKITVTCTDNGKTSEAYLDRYVEGKYMDIILNTVRLKLVYTGKIYAGSMAGLEFTAKSPDITVIKQGR